MHYIAKPAMFRPDPDMGQTWFDSYTEAYIVEDWRPDMKAAIFKGYKEDLSDALNGAFIDSFVCEEPCMLEEFWELAEDDYIDFTNRLFDFAVGRAREAGWKRCDHLITARESRPIFCAPDGLIWHGQYRTAVIDGVLMEVPHCISEFYIGYQGSIL